MLFRRPKIRESLINMEISLMHYEKKKIKYEVKGECIVIKMVSELLSLTICFIYSLNRCLCDYYRL